MVKGIPLIDGLIDGIVDAVETSTIGKYEKEFLIKIKITKKHNTREIMVNTYKYI